MVTGESGNVFGGLFGGLLQVDVGAQFPGEVILGLTLLVLFVVIALFVSAVRIVQPYEQGLAVVLGKFTRVLNPGFNLVAPMVTHVIKLDLRTQVLDVPRQEIITKDNAPTNVDAIIYIKIIDPKKAYFEVTDYRLATVALAQTTLRSIMGDMQLDEIFYNREQINSRLREVLDTATDNWGVKVEAVEIREVDPLRTVKAAMEEQTASERQRRAAILRADGEKKSAILVAEGDKQARILEAEGVRQAKVLEAEGQRLATILETQGESQKLRILSLGAATLDTKAIAVLSMETLKAMAKGEATKIIFPFEISRIVEGISDYLGVTKKVPEREIASFEQLEDLLGKADDVLGPLPKAEELARDMELARTEAEEAAAEAARTRTEIGSDEGGED